MWKRSRPHQHIQTDATHVNMTGDYDDDDNNVDDDISTWKLCNNHTSDTHTTLMIMSFCNWIAIVFIVDQFSCAHSTHTHTHTRPHTVYRNIKFAIQYRSKIQRFKSKRLGCLIEDKESHLVCECKSISIDLYNIFFCFVLFWSQSVFVVLGKRTNNLVLF